MKIAWFTEGGFIGQIPRNHRNMKTPVDWMCVMKAIHHPILQIHNVKEKFDLGIVVLPKKGIDILSQYPLIENMRQCCDKIAFMQEGPNWFFQDYPLAHQIWFYNTLMAMDWLYVHNESDVQYYKGLTGKECKVMSSTMVEELIQNIQPVERKNVITGGNFCSWYGGFDSFVIAQEFNCDIYAPSMGRKIENEEYMPDLNHLPYMDWFSWMETLNTFKYGIHLMRTHAAGTFAMNCSYLGIPCIGYKGLDTQQNLHPNLTVEIGDLDTARKLAKQLKEDNNFYNYNSNLTKKLYKQHHSEELFLNKIKL
jgi:hypothetical protein